MKRFMLFCGNYYYPSGGVDDLVCLCDSITQAKEFLKEYLLKDFTIYSSDKKEYLDYEIDNNWFHIYDISECKKIEIEKESFKKFVISN